uniref:Uncharacterized protein n=1 Tax=Helianthus annuus TaxID=4232 RepID=A0A251TAM8_HELAN
MFLPFLITRVPCSSFHKIPRIIFSLIPYAHPLIPPNPPRRQFPSQSSSPTRKRWRSRTVGLSSMLFFAV